MKRMLKVEFIRGPLDQEPFGSGPPVEVIAWLICKDASKLPAGKPSDDGEAIISVAIYELELDDGMFRYQFGKAISAQGSTGSLSAVGIRPTIADTIE